MVKRKETPSPPTFDRPVTRGCPPLVGERARPDPDQDDEGPRVSVDGGPIR